jgi:hypothetical protein
MMARFSCSVGADHPSFSIRMRPLASASTTVASIVST